VKKETKRDPEKGNLVKRGRDSKTKQKKRRNGQREAVGTFTVCSLV